MFSGIFNVYAVNTGNKTTENNEITSEKILSYENYINKYSANDIVNTKVDVDIAGYTSCDNVTVKNDGNKKTLLTKESGFVEWTVNIPKTGLYAINIDYYPTEGTGSTIQRSVYIDGKLPFDEAYCIEFSRLFKDSSKIVHINNENDIRPRQAEQPEWMNVYIKDSLGFFGKLNFYLTQGEHKLRLSSLTEPMEIGSVKLESINDETRDYKTVLNEYNSKNIKPVQGVLENGILKIQAEETYTKSDPTLYPVTDNSSPANEPYSYNKQKLNSIGGTRWENPGQWISWQVDVPESGLYEIGFRSKQNFVRDIDSVRSLYIDGKLPFKEAADLSFSFNSNWTVSLAGSNEPYLFYLEKGKRTIKMEVTIGKLANTLMRANSSLKILNQTNWDLLTLLGTSPDLNRDYNIDKYMPQVVTTFKEQAAELKSIVNDWVKLTGKNDANVAIMNQLIFELDKMSKDAYTIPGMYVSFKDTVSSFANMLLEAKKQPLIIDYLFIAEKGAKLPKANLGIVSSMKYGFLKFFISFFSDYNVLAENKNTDTSKPVKVWIGNGLSGGRDQALVLSQMILQDFSPKYKINVNLQLVPPATILTATVAGKGPDVALQISGSDPANYAMRKAVVDLSKLDGFNDVKKRFDESAFESYKYQGGIYALPETFSFPMVFYRKDILSEMGIDIEKIKTWQQLMETLPLIQRKNMNIAIPASFNSYIMFLYQNGGNLYKNNNKASDIDSKISLDSFSYMMKFYTDYSLPFSYNFITRFRTGEIPIGIDDYTTYNLLQIGAPEINGQWGMMPIFGVDKGNGVIDNTAPVASAGCVLMSASKNVKNSWEFMKWLTESDTQFKYGKELESVMGIGARYNSANIEALKKLPWQVNDKNALFTQMKNLRGIPEVPGGYLTSRNVGFAINSVYSTNTNARETLLTYVDQINQEIQIKRSEFGLN